MISYVTKCGSTFGSNDTPSRETHKWITWAARSPWSMIYLREDKGPGVFPSMWELCHRKQVTAASKIISFLNSFKYIQINSYKLINYININWSYNSQLYIENSKNRKKYGYLHVFSYCFMQYLFDTIFLKLKTDKRKI